MHCCLLCTIILCVNYSFLLSNNFFCYPIQALAFFFLTTFPLYDCCYQDFLSLSSFLYFLVSTFLPLKDNNFKESLTEFKMTQIFVVFFPLYAPLSGFVCSPYFLLSSCLFTYFNMQATCSGFHCLFAYLHLLNRGLLPLKYTILY